MSACPLCKRDCRGAARADDTKRSLKIMAFNRAYWAGHILNSFGVEATATEAWCGNCLRGMHRRMSRLKGLPSEVIEIGYWSGRLMDYAQGAKNREALKRRYRLWNPLLERQCKRCHCQYIPKTRHSRYCAPCSRSRRIEMIRECGRRHEKKRKRYIATIAKSAANRESRKKRNEKIMRLYKAGVWNLEIANRIGVLPATVGKIIHEHRGGFVRPRRGWKKKPKPLHQAPEIVAAYLAGNSLRQVGKMFGVHSVTVLWRLKRAGIKGRKMLKAPDAKERRLFLERKRRRARSIAAGKSRPGRYAENIK